MFKYFGFSGQTRNVSGIEVYIGHALLHRNTTALSITRCTVGLSQGVGGAFSTIVLF